MIMNGLVCVCEYRNCGIQRRDREYNGRNADGSWMNTNDINNAMSEAEKTFSIMIMLWLCTRTYIQYIKLYYQFLPLL